MALETLKDVIEVDGFVIKRILWSQPAGNHIEINDEINAITFKLQKGTIKKRGVNGCQVDTIIETARLILEGLNKKLPCEENSFAITHLSTALALLKKRKVNREAQGVEGTNKAIDDSSTSATVDFARALQLLKTEPDIKMVRLDKETSIEESLWTGRHIAVGKKTDGGPLIYDYREECEGLIWLPKPEDITAEDWVVVT